jgi:hypothetical protein
MEGIMNWQNIAHAIRQDAAYWMALVVCPCREQWKDTYRYFYSRAEMASPFVVPFVINFEKELVEQW